MKYTTLGLTFFSLNLFASEPGTIDLNADSIHTRDNFNLHHFIQSGDAEVDIIAVFESSAADWAHRKMSKGSKVKSVKSFIDDRVNGAVAAPFKGIKLSGGGTIKINFVETVILEEDFSSETHKSLHKKIKSSDDWIIRLGAIREEHKADLVAIFKQPNSSDDAAGKAAYVRKITDHSAYKTYGFFSVNVDRAYKESYYMTTTHELGHILGAGHNIAALIDSNGNPKRKDEKAPYNQGYGVAYNLSEYGETKPYAASIMSYTFHNGKNQCDLEQRVNDHEYDKTGDWGELPLTRFHKSCRRVPYFSDGGVSLGRGLSYPTNNASAIADSARAVAGYY
ncbi:M12 family metallo-peptidase [Pseudoalteromonas obscura]|uniref:Zinc-dependent metalloprotease family protein n=1 Tax=Pseudoalteromonas obscura TaxID=3048491 RepID=A0ABT7EDV3_9GAMM|nr:M12 family metallo-peptidase [Pseudoalteromonas sp. P94(2023)]MDK2593454.1 zinc-dependent metalloprotease family protein [Pseudoalteromonas sp. P94(2023)]